MNSDKIPLQAESPFMNGLNPTAEFNDGLLGSTDGSSTFLKANMASKVRLEENIGNLKYNLIELFH